MQQAWRFRDPGTGGPKTSGSQKQLIKKQQQADIISYQSQMQMGQIIINQPSWSAHDQIVYYIFLKKYRQIFIKSESNQSHGIFPQMSRYLKAKTSIQCCIHFTDHKATYKTIDGIMKFVLDNFYSICYQPYDLMQQALKINKFLVQQKQNQNKAFRQHGIINPTLISAKLQQNVGSKISIKNCKTQITQRGEKTYLFPQQLIISLQKMNLQPQKKQNSKANKIQQQKNLFQNAWFIKRNQTILKVPETLQNLQSQKQNIIQNQKSQSQLVNEQQLQLKNTSNLKDQAEKTTKSKLWLKSEVQKLLLNFSLTYNLFERATHGQKSVLYKKLQQDAEIDKNCLQVQQKIRVLMKGYSNYKQMLEKQLLFYDINSVDLWKYKISTQNTQYSIVEKGLNIKQSPLFMEKNPHYKKNQRYRKMMVPMKIKLHLPKNYQNSINLSDDLNFFIDKINFQKEETKDKKQQSSRMKENQTRIIVKIKQQIFEQLIKKWTTHKIQKQQLKIICINNNKIQIHLRINNKIFQKVQ